MVFVRLSNKNTPKPLPVKQTDAAEEEKSNWADAVATV
jgi:hypothetical protein